MIFKTLKTDLREGWFAVILVQQCDGDGGGVAELGDAVVGHDHLQGHGVRPELGQQQLPVQWGARHHETLGIFIQMYLIQI